MKHLLWVCREENDLKAEYRELEKAFNVVKAKQEELHEDYLKLSSRMVPFTDWYVGAQLC